MDDLPAATYSPYSFLGWPSCWHSRYLLFKLNTWQAIADWKKNAFIFWQIEDVLRCDGHTGSPLLSTFSRRCCSDEDLGWIPDCMDPYFAVRSGHIDPCALLFALLNPLCRDSAFKMLICSVISHSLLLCMNGKSWSWPALMSGLWSMQAGFSQHSAHAPLYL